MPMKINENNKKIENRGGKRAGAGRKKLGKAILYAAMPPDSLNKLKEQAERENMLVGDWIVKCLKL